MVFSKSFGYAVRGLIFIALKSKENKSKLVQAEDVATALGVPRHFMSKILKRLASYKVLISVKGPFGGFAVADEALSMKLMQFLELMDGLEVFHSCILQIGECGDDNPCPVHFQVRDIKARLSEVMNETSFAGLLNGDNDSLVRSITTRGSFEYTP